MPGTELPVEVPVEADIPELTTGIEVTGIVARLVERNTGADSPKPGSGEVREAGIRIRDWEGETWTGVTVRVDDWEGETWAGVTRTLLTPGDSRVATVGFEVRVGTALETIPEETIPVADNLEAAAKPG